MKQPRGFNLVELMIIVSIIGVLIAISVPALLEYRSERQSLDISRQISLHLRGLRHLATTSNVALMVRVTQGNLSGLRGRIDVFPSTDNRCRNAAVAADPKLGMNLNGMGADNVQIVHLSPQNEGALTFCIKPDGSTTTELGRPLVNDSNSASDGCDAAQEEAWAKHCNQYGTMCMKIASLNNTFQGSNKRCWNANGDGDVSHIGLDHIISMSFNGGARLVQ